MNDGFRELFRRGTDHDPFPYQVALAEAPVLPRLVRAPTGAGKTAAAVLAWLYRRRSHPDPGIRAATPRRLVYCLPLRTLVEQTAGAIRLWLERLEVSDKVGLHVLLGGEVDRDWVRDPAGDAVVVGTMDMLLSRALNRGFAAARYRWPIEFALLNNDCLWILDEVQLMGNGLVTSAQLQGLRESLETYGPAQSIWMSATVDPSWIAGPDFAALEARHVHELGPDDLSHPTLGGRLRARKTLRRLPLATDRAWARTLASEIVAAHRPHTRTLVVLNTVERAAELYRELRRQRPEAETLLIHARFRPPERQAKVARLLAAPPDAGSIVVATQVVEAGVDITAATLFTEVAPWASIVQRLGRCNRYGEEQDASVYWIDGLAGSPEPYGEEECARTRELLFALEGQTISPERLRDLPPGDPTTTTHVLRLADLVDLFDTEPDLSGNDVDVSRFIRDDADVDCHVFWRYLDDGIPPDAPRPHRDEICPAPVFRLRELVRRADGPRVFLWDHLARQWRPAGRDELRPGTLVLIDARAGGYSSEFGFDPKISDPVDPVTVAAEAAAPDSFDEEEAAETDGGWVSLTDHGRETAAAAQAFAGELLVGPAGQPWVHEAVVVAARWHDLGKVHPVFQSALLHHLPEHERATRVGTVWAKSGQGVGRYERPHFRHELVSALLVLELGRARGREIWGISSDAPDEALDLVAYLVGAHHGKIRLAIRSLPGEHPMAGASNEPRIVARGVYDGEELDAARVGELELPRLRLDLSVMAIGLSTDGERSWLERTLRLRDRFGVFRLGYLEAIVRLADWESSARRAKWPLGVADA